MGKLKSLLVKLYSIGVIKKSNFFDKEWYINEYSDLGGIYRVFPALHYAFFGYKEGRNPSKSFVTDYYLNAYEDVKKSGLNPLYHYERVGKSENRRINGSSHIYNLINTSLFFNNDWYVRNYMMYTKGQAPVVDYLMSKSLKNPSPMFYSKEYLYLNPDVAIHNINPLTHYLNYGRYENRLPALTELKEYNAPKGTISIEKDFFARKSNDKKMVTVLASFSASGKIEDFQIYLLKGLRKISDYIVIVSDNPVYEEELTKIDDICNHCIFLRHGEYDFGSYKYGYNYLIENKILENDDNLLFINDSNYGPVYPFENVIDDFKSKQCDFYGLTYGNNYDLDFLQSFFYIFKPNVYNSTIFKDFISSVKKQLAQAWVALEYEYTFTNILEQGHFSYTSYIPKTFMSDINKAIPTKYGYTLMNEYKYPLVKRKVLQGSTVDSVDDILEHIKLNNRELYEIIIKRENIDGYVKEKYIDIPSKYLLLSNYAKKEQEIREKIKKGEKVNVIFFAYSTETFIAEQVMLNMMADDNYAVQLYFIPDIRNSEHTAALNYMKQFQLFQEKYPYAKKVVNGISERLVDAQYINAEIFNTMVNNTLREKVVIDNKEYIKEKCFEGFYNIIKDSDIVFYPHIQDISFSLYNPFYAVRLNKLSVYIPHEIYPFKFDRNYYRMDNFNNFWKVFLDSNISFEEYRQYGQCHGINAVVTGLNSDYYSFKRESITNERKKIVIAPHFSLHNGKKMLNTQLLENYGNLLLELPAKFKDIDFIYLFSEALKNKLLYTENLLMDEFKNYEKKLSTYNNAVIAGEEKYREMILSADGIILDSGILFTDTILANIPCLYFVNDNKSEKNKFNEIGYYMYEAVYKAENEKEIYSFINNVIINNKDTIKEKRSNVLNTVKLERTLSSKITDYLNKLLCN